MLTPRDGDEMQPLRPSVPATERTCHASKPPKAGTGIQSGSSTVHLPPPVRLRPSPPSLLASLPLIASFRLPAILGDERKGCTTIVPRTPGVPIGCAGGTPS